MKMIRFKTVHGEYFSIWPTDVYLTGLKNDAPCKVYFKHKGTFLYIEETLDEATARLEEVTK